MTKWPSAVDPQFLDANGVGGLNMAYGTVSGAVASIGSGAWALPGLLAPEAAGFSFSGNVATVTLPAPWGIISASGVVVRAHGTLTGQDTQTYSVNFSSLIPGSGSVTAYLAATVQQIQQNPFPVPGPPPGFPSYNPNYVPTVGYATNLYTVALAATTSAPNNASSFELLRTTLTAGQSSVSSFSTIGWVLAADRKAFPNSIISSGGILVPSQLQQIIVPSVPGLTFTLPSASNAGGLPASFANSTAGNCVIAASGTDRISGMSGGGAASITLPPSGTVLMIGNAQQGLWEVIGFNTATNNTWTGSNTFTQSVVIDGNLTTVGSTFFGNSGTFLINPNFSGNQILAFAPSQFLEFIPGFGFSFSTTENVAITAPGGASISAALSAGGAITAGGPITATGNVIANGGRLLGTVPARGSGNNDAATLLQDFPTASGYTILPNGLIFEWGTFNQQGPSTATYAFPLAFPNQALSFVCSFGYQITGLVGTVGGEAVNSSQYNITTTMTAGSPQGIFFFAIGN